MRQRLRFYFEHLIIALAGGFVGFFIAKGDWYVTPAVLLTTVFGVYRMWDQYRPDAAEHRAIRLARRRAGSA